MIPPLVYALGIIGSVMNLPQVYLTFLTQDVKTISWVSIVLNIASCICWLVYYSELLWIDTPIIISYGFVISSYIAILCMKFLFSRQQESVVPDLLLEDKKILADSITLSQKMI